MPAITKVLVALAVVMLGVLAWRFTGGPIGPRTYGFMAATVAVIVAAFVTARRGRPAEGARPAAR
jgi:hypothetical protein